MFFTETTKKLHTFSLFRQPDFTPAVASFLLNSPSLRTKVRSNPTHTGHSLYIHLLFHTFPWVQNFPLYSHFLFQVELSNVDKDLAIEERIRIQFFSILSITPHRHHIFRHLHQTEMNCLYFLVKGKTNYLYSQKQRNCISTNLQTNNIPFNILKSTNINHL